MDRKKKRKSVRPLAGRRLLIQRRHRIQRTDEPWDAKRFWRLQNALGCSTEELADFAVIPVQLLKRWIANDRIPAYVALHYVALERAFTSVKFGGEMQHAMPLNELICSEETMAA